MDWNSSRAGYRLRYTFSTPTSHPSTSHSDDTGEAEVLTADSSIVYELRLLLLPLSHYLIIDANLAHISPLDGTAEPVSTNHKLTLDVLNYVSVDELYGCLTRWQERTREQQQQQQHNGNAGQLQLSAWVYRDVGLLLAPVVLLHRRHLLLFDGLSHLVAASKDGGVELRRVE